MQSGVLNSENLSQIFRGLSQKRRHGTLEINYADQVQRVLFAQGKIVEVIGTVNPVHEVLELLQAADVIPASTGPVQVQRYGDLLLCGRTNGAAGDSIEPSVVRRAVKHRVLDRLYRLNLDVGAFYTFKVEMIEYDREFCPAISVGQLLLDFVALKDDARQFLATFPDDAVIGRARAPGRALTEEESVIYALTEHSITLNDIRRRSMLSGYHLQDALLSLHGQGCIGVMEDAPPPTPEVSANGGEAGDGMFAAFDSLIESVGTELENIVEPAPAETKSAPLVTEGDVTQRVVQPRPAVAREARPAAEPPKKAAAQAAPKISLGMRLNIWNAQLLRSQVTAHCVVFFLLLAALLAPLLLWVDAIRAFGDF